MTEMRRQPLNPTQPLGLPDAAVPATTSGRALATCRERLHRAITLLATANAALRGTVAARDQALAELRAAERDQDAFVVATVHELKTPLTAIKGRAQVLRLRVQRGPGPDQAGLVAGLLEIGAAADRLNAALDDLIDEVRRPLPDLDGDQGNDHGTDPSGPWSADGTASRRRRSPQDRTAWE